MDIGLYKLKEQTRVILKPLVLKLRNTNPNHLSLTIIPLGLVTSLCLLQSKSQPLFYALAVLFMLLRIIFAVLDGYVAQAFAKESAWGNILNRLCPELSDVMILSTTAWMVGRVELGLALLATAWITSFVGIIGPVAGKPIQSVGPVGQTDRLVALMIAVTLQFAAHLLQWSFDFIYVFVLWSIVGGIITITLRLNRLRSQP